MCLPSISRIVSASFLVLVALTLLAVRARASWLTETALCGLQIPSSLFVPLHRRGSRRFGYRRCSAYPKGPLPSRPIVCTGVCKCSLRDDGIFQACRCGIICSNSHAHRHASMFRHGNEALGFQYRYTCRASRHLLLSFSDGGSCRDCVWPS